MIFRAGFDHVVEIADGARRQLTSMTGDTARFLKTGNPLDLVPGYTFIADTIQSARQATKQFEAAGMNKKELTAAMQLNFNPALAPFRSILELADGMSYRPGNFGQE